MADYERVLQFWLGELDDDGNASADVRRSWFSKDDTFDADVRRRFEADYDAIVAGECDSWLDTPRGLVAYIIVLDQLSRNMFRGTGKMYAADALALEAATMGVERGDADELAFAEQWFLYMPFMHSEQLAVQDRSVALFEGLAKTAPEACRSAAESALDYAHRHRDIVHRFGRYPHRNELLGRDHTPEEREFLAQPGSSF